MILQLTRLWHSGECSLGFLRCEDMAFTTLEDPPQREKIPGRTRIPAGEYQITLRENSGMAERYRDRFGPDHYGMIWLRDVPRFEWVYIHVGNYAKDTEGCILVGKSMDMARNMIGDSTNAYAQLWQRVIPHVYGGGSASIIIEDCDQ